MIYTMPSKDTMAVVWQSSFISVDLEEKGKGRRKRRKEKRKKINKVTEVSYITESICDIFSMPTSTYSWFLFPFLKNVTREPNAIMESWRALKDAGVARAILDVVMIVAIQRKSGCDSASGESR